MAGDFYSDLDVATDASEKEIKKRFRRLAALHHPDKTQGNAVEIDFVRLKMAQDTLVEPARRFAYDRFGPAVMSEYNQEKLVTIREYVYAGLQGMAPGYIRDGLVLFLMNYLVLPKWARFWRYFAIAALALLEAYLLTHSWSPPALVKTVASFVQRRVPDLFPRHILPFQLLEIARTLSISLNIFISKLTPPAAQQKGKDAYISVQEEAQIQANAQGAMRADLEATGLLTLALTPFRGNADQVKSLRRGMKDGMVVTALKNSPEVKEAMDKKRERQVEAQTQNGRAH